MDKQKILIYKRNVKYPRIELNTGNIVLILPNSNNLSADLLIKKHKSWIDKKMKLIDDIKEKFKKKKLITRKEDVFIRNTLNLVNKYCNKLKTQPKNIKFRYMKTKWGSCSKKETIYLNKLLKFIPNNLIAYVVYHELCHLKIRKHNYNFWLLIRKEFPLYEESEKALFGYWFLLKEKLGNNLNNYTKA